MWIILFSSPTGLCLFEVDGASVEAQGGTVSDDGWLLLPAWVETFRDVVLFSFSQNSNAWTWLKKKKNSGSVKGFWGKSKFPPTPVF